MEPVAILFGAACLGALCFSYRDGGAPHGMAWAMTALWAVANILWLYDAMTWLPMFDLLLAIWSYVLLVQRPSAWLFVVATMFAFRMTLHVPGNWGMMPVEAYLNWVNAAFLAALIAISWKGAQRAFTDTVDCIRRFLHLCGVVAAKLVKAP